MKKIMFLLLISVALFSCTSESGKRQPKPTTVNRVIKEVGQSYVISREIDTAYRVGDTIRVLFGTSSNTSRMAVAVVIR